MSPTTTITPAPKWERNWIRSGRAYDIPTICRVFDTKHVNLYRLDARGSYIAPAPPIHVRVGRFVETTPGAYRWSTEPVVERGGIRWGVVAVIAFDVAAIVGVVWLSVR